MAQDKIKEEVDVSVPAATKRAYEEDEDDTPTQSKRARVEPPVENALIHQHDDLALQTRMEETQGKIGLAVPEQGEEKNAVQKMELTKVEVADGQVEQNVGEHGSMEVDGEPIIDVPPAVDIKESAPWLYLLRFWRHNVHKRQRPQFEWVQDDTTQKWGCSLNMSIPPASTRSFTVEPLYETKEEAKDAAARIVIKYGVPEQAAEAAKNEQERRHKANQGLPAQAVREKEKKLEAQHVLAEKSSLVVQRDMAESGGDQPISLLYQTMAQNMGNGHNPNFEFGIDATSQFHTATLTVKVLPTLTKTYVTPQPYKTRKLAKEAVCRAAIKDGIIKIIQEEHSLAARKKRGEVSEHETEDDNPPQQLHVMCTRFLGSSSTLIYEYNCPSNGLFGASVKIKITPEDIRSFKVEPNFKSKKDARREVSRVALAGGLLEVLKQLKDDKTDCTLENVAGRDGKKKAGQSIPKPGTHMDKNADELENAVGYLNLCFQTWHGNIAPLSWEFSVSPPAKTGATLFVRLSPSLTRKYTVPATYKGKKDAKEAVAKKAIKDGLLGLIRPKKSDSSRTHLRGGMVGRGGSSFDRGGTFNNQPFFPQSQLPASQFNTISPGFQVPHMQPALGGPSMTGSNIFAAQGQQMLDSQQHNPFMIQQRLQQQQAEQQRFGNQSGSGMYNNGMQNQQPGIGAFSWVAPNQQQPGNAAWGIPPHDQMMQIVQQLDDFCLEWMGPGHLPQYEVHRDERTGLFGCGVRIPITPANIKSFWTRHEFTARNDAQEACARIAMQDGIIDTVKREFPPMTSLSSPMPGPSMGGGGMNTASQGGLGVFGFNGSNAFPNMHTGQGGFQQGGRGAGAFGRGGAFTGRGGTQTRPIKSNNTSSSAKGAPHKTVASHSESKSRKGESAVTQLNKTCQYVIGSEPQDMPEYEFLTDTTGSKFGAVVHVPLDSNQTTVFSIPSSFTSKREAKEAVAKLAIDQGVLQQIKDKAEKRIDQIQSSLKDANQPYSPLKIGQKPQSDRPKTFVHQLQEFTRSHNLPKPVFTSETGPAQEGGDGKEQVLRVWVVIGDLKFELDKERFGKEHDGKERLAARVLKHLQKEESERLAASTS